MQFKPFSSGIEVSGATGYSLVAGFKHLKHIASRYLLEEGLGARRADGSIALDPHAWYPQDAWLRVFERIAKEIGDAQLFQIGCVLPENAAFPPTVHDLPSALRAIDVAYHRNHRKNGIVLYDAATGTMLEGIGHYRADVRPEQRCVVCVCENPQPCAFDRGIISTVALRFEPDAKVVHDDSQPCRKRGAESCTYIVRY